MNTLFLVCAIAGGVILLFRIVFMLIGLDHGDIPDAHVDISAGHDVPGHDGPGVGFQILSLQSIAGFLVMFGLVGMGLLRVRATDWIAMLGALAAGAVTGLATALIFRSMGNLQSEGTLVIANAVGQVGTVYLTIPEQGTGVINVTVQGGLRSLDAVSEEHTRIPTGAVVKVVGVTGGHVLIVKEQAAGSS